MVPAILTAFLWSYCVIAARRSIDQLGENLANAARIMVALVVLGLLAHAFGMGLEGGGLFYFFLSGVVGFGLGDIGIFHALPRLGSRLTLLMAQCVAVPIAGLVEWVWLGTTVEPVQLLAIGIILVGIILALIPKHIPVHRLSSFLVGILFGLLAAAGQGMGVVFSRKAYEAAHAAGNWASSQGILESIWMGATSGYQRLIGGALVIVLFYCLSFFIRNWWTRPRVPHGSDPLSRKAYFVLVTAFSGPILGIICFQWALATTPGAVVQPIVATTPLVVIPLAWYFEGDRPTARALWGALISVAGVVLLAVVTG